MVQAEFATAMKQEVAITAALQQHRAAELNLYEYIRANDLSAADLDHIARYGALQRQRIVDAQVELMRHGHTMQRIRERLIDARQKREAIDRLEERHRDRHRVEVDREWARDLDEIATQRAARPSMTSPMTIASLEAAS